MKNLNEIQSQMQTLSNLVEDAINDNERVEQLTDILACNKHEVVAEVEKLKTSPSSPSPQRSIKRVLDDFIERLEDAGVCLYDGEPRINVDNYDDEATITIEKDEAYISTGDYAEQIEKAFEEEDQALSEEAEEPIKVTVDTSTEGAE